MNPIYFIVIAYGTALGALIGFWFNSIKERQNLLSMLKGHTSTQQSHREESQNA